MANYFITGSTQNADSGILRRGGVVASTRWKSKGLGDTKYDQSPSLYSGMPATAKALSSGSFARMVATEFVIRRISTRLANTASTTLLSGGANYGQLQSIHKSEVFNTTFLNELSWAADKDGQPTYTLTSNTTVLTYSNDDAARPSYAVPGELVLKTVAPVPVLFDYSAKTG